MCILIIIAKALTDKLVYFICGFFALASVIYPFFYVLKQFTDAKCRNIFQLENQREVNIFKSRSRCPSFLFISDEKSQAKL